ncbi:nitroreductase family protein [Microbispora sp. RL4-1S]|uniref:Putative NAD(P)H nitroreductase n=1 Tax=Microbispora oryzae TaxID=2806554 RepID=A0A940WM19_9ACTN|nr:nitroreductase family protein [Microbispora oryzae]MBP2705468.1 nitroreductase family protein [Microbispora oryzae]
MSATPEMSVHQAVRSRCGGGRLLDEAPGDDDLVRLTGLAMNSPDHAALRPWRLIALRDDARKLLGEAMAEAGGDAAKPLRAPLLVAIVLVPREHPKVPEWEQLAAATCVVAMLSLLLHAEGWAAKWRTGPLLDAASVRAALRITGSERLLGFLYVGRPDPGAHRPPRPVTDPLAHLEFA